jgi:hypothetical protein
LAIIWSIVLLGFSLFTLTAETAPSHGIRSFDEIFPSISPAVREAAFSGEGYGTSYARVPPSDLIGSGQSTLDSQIVNSILIKNPGVLVETLLVIPGKEGEYTLLDVYNALGKIRGLSGRLYHSFTRKEEIPLFEDVTRINVRRNAPVDDPPPATTIPTTETIYIRLKDVNFGNSFYRGDIHYDRRGLRYSLTNNRNLTYFFVPVIREERFTAQLYFEIISEGILIYGLAGTDVSDFVSSRIDIPSAISKRLAVIIGWVSEGITGK